MNAARRRPPGLKITETHTDTTGTLTLRGELDLPTSIMLIESARRALRRRPRLLRVDLRDVEFLDITGARALISCRRLASAAHADFELSALSDPARRLLEVSRLQAVFDTTPATQATNGRATPRGNPADSSGRPRRGP